MKKEEFQKILDEEETNYNLGGDEDSEGNLCSGEVDFDRIKRAFNETIITIEEELKQNKKRVSK